MFGIVAEAFLITTALSVDAFVSGFAYGANRIRIPLLSAILINVICSAVLAVSLFFGTFLGRYIPNSVTLGICAAILMLIGLIKIAGCVINRIKKPDGNSGTRGGKSIFRVFAAPETADANNNKVLSAGEASVLALALSLDGLTVGAGAGLINSGRAVYILIIAFSLVTGLLYLTLGRFAGDRIARKTKLNLSWLSGVMLIGLAIIKLTLGAGG